MITSNFKYEMLSNRPAFNGSVRHVKSTIAIAERIQDGENIADVLNELLDDKSISTDELLALISMLIVDKFAYVCATKNLSSVQTDLPGIEAVTKTWNAVDLIVVYQHPDIGVMVLNPKNPSHLARLDRLNKYEHIAAYAGCFGKPVDPSIGQKAVDTLIACFEGAKLKIDPALLKGSCSYKRKAVKADPSEVPVTEKKQKGKAAPAVAKGSSAKKSIQIGSNTVGQEAPAAAEPAPTAKPAAPAIKPGARMTPMYAVPVTNELFHNGNVEAWKRIIESYKAKHVGLDVLVYYDGERISNLNALFKWGKVKHGSVIQFAVTGENICDVAKLQRYLAQGASLMYEAFLRGPVNGVLALF